MIDFEALLPAATLAAATNAVSGVVSQQSGVTVETNSPPMSVPVVEVAQDVGGHER